SLGAICNGEQGSSARDIDVGIARAAIDNLAAGRQFFDNQPVAFDGGDLLLRGRSGGSVMGGCVDGSDENQYVVFPAGRSEGAGKADPGMKLAGKIEQWGGVFQPV